MSQFQKTAGASEQNPGDSDALPDPADAQQSPHETQVTPSIATEPEGTVGSGLNPP